MVRQVGADVQQVVGAHNVAPGLAGVGGLRAELLLNAQQLVVLGQPLRPGACSSGVRVLAGNNQTEPFRSALSGFEAALGCLLESATGHSHILICLVARLSTRLATKLSTVVPKQRQYLGE